VAGRRSTASKTIVGETARRPCFQIDKPPSALPKRVRIGYGSVMKRLIASVVLLLAAMSPQARAQATPDDQYVIIYSLMQQADGLENSGDLRQALAQYVETQDELQRFQKLFPDWHPNIIAFRLNYLADKIAECSANLPVTNPPAATATAPPPAPAAAAATAATATADLESQLGALHEQLQRLQTDNLTLQLKLKEALTPPPAMIDAGELAKAQGQVQSLMKENDLLKAGLSQAQTAATTGFDAVAFAQLRRQLAEADQKLAQQTDRADKLALENRALQARVQSLEADAGGVEALREENQLLKKQLADLRSATADGSSIADLDAELARLRAQLAALQSAAAVDWLEKAALENRLERFQVAPANGELAGQLSALRARLAVDEAQAVPYTPEELALFKQSAPQLVASPPEADSDAAGEASADTMVLVAEAQRDFSSRQFDKAEAAYLEILRRDENNPLSLANLATIEIDLNKLDEGEKYIRLALAQNPNDAYNLSVLGHLQFLQGKYDAAQDTLSRAAALDPQSPQIQNYLGVVLAQKGLRAQAETALRKALQFDPDYGDAHNNLAVIYISQNPPMAELARWHYQRALEAGQPRNPDLEKMLAEKGVPVNPQ
jgi:Flp pilus assembly protein TadD